MTKPTKRGICAHCGNPARRTHYGYNKFCGLRCKRKAMGIVSFPGFELCPVEGCHGTIRVSSLATCSACWSSLPLHLRSGLVQAWDASKLAGVSQREEAKAAYEQLKSLAIVAAEGRLARESETEQKRARRRDLVRHRTSKRQVAA